MLVDWFTVGAQALNFLILVWLLKRFLYRPVLAAIDARERNVAARLDEAAAREAAAAHERDALAAARKAFEDERQARLATVEEEAKALRARLAAEAQRQAREERDHIASVVELERRTLLLDGGRGMLELVFTIVRKVLADLAGETLDQRLAAVFAHRLETLPPDGQTALRAATGEPVVRTARPLPATLQTAIAGALAELVPSLTTARFESAPELVAGLEVIIGDYRFAWSLDDYVALLAAAADRELAGSGPSAADGG